MADSTTLAPCPFCNAAAHFESDSDGWHWIECESCGMQGNRGASLMEDCKPGLAEAWNRRAQAPAPQGPALVPLTDGQAKAVLWKQHLRWMEAAGLDTEGMRPTGDWLDHWLLYVRAIEAAHGITKKGGTA